MPKLRNGNNGVRTRALDCESDILPTELPRSTPISLQYYMSAKCVQCNQKIYNYKQCSLSIVRHLHSTNIFK